jgi:hypothetical protein
VPRLSGTFIYHNYRQALDIIREGGQKLAILSSSLHLGPDDYENFLILERQYLHDLKTEPEEVSHTIEYMEALGRLEEARYVSP